MTKNKFQPVYKNITSETETTQVGPSAYWGKGQGKYSKLWVCDKFSFHL